MSRFSFCMPVLLLLLLPFFCLGQAVSEKIVQEAEHARYIAVISSDTTDLERFLADEFVYHQPTGDIISKNVYLQNTADGNPSILAAEITHLNIRIYDNAAVSGGSVTIDVRINGNERAADLLFLNVWILRDGRLQLAARQSSFQ